MDNLRERVICKPLSDRRDPVCRCCLCTTFAHRTATVRERSTPPAEGVTKGGFWTMPLGWDVKVGTLEILDETVPAGRRMLADYQKVPTSIGMWSGPTPAGGVVTEVVLVSGNLENVDVK